MATSPQQNQQQNRQQDSQPGNQSGGDAGSQQRSEGLLPAGQDEGGGDQDGRFDVAEEVNLDQQSDALRRVGKAPKDPGKP